MLRSAIHSRFVAMHHPTILAIVDCVVWFVQVCKHVVRGMLCIVMIVLFRLHALLCRIGVVVLLEWLGNKNLYVA